MKNLFILLFICSFSIAHSCINEFDKVPGVSVSDEYGYGLNKPYIDNIELKAFIDEKMNSCSSLNSVKCNDLVVALLYQKDFKNALKYSEQLYQKFPKEYNVVITYAATLELNGKFEEALKYLNDAMIINPNSHGGSEWIHRKILEDLIGMNTDEYSVIGFNSGTNIFPASDKTKEELRTILGNLSFQISERYFFIGQKDAKFGKLLFDYGNLLFLNGWYGLSKEMFQNSIKFGFNKELVRKRLDYVKSNEDLLNKSDEQKDSIERQEKQLSKNKKIDSAESFNGFSLLMGGLILLVVLILVFLVRRNKDQIR